MLVIHHLHLGRSLAPYRELDLSAFGMRILLIEDDVAIAKAVAEVLGDKGYSVEMAHDGQTGLAFAETGLFDLIVLDLTLPKLNGILLCQKLRQQNLSVPVLMLTARDTTADKIVGLDAGADDYIIKPFEISELLARVRSLLRRRSLPFAETLTWEKLLLRVDSCETFYDGIILRLTPKEYALLELFLKNGSRILTRQYILERVWTFDDLPGEDTVKAHLRSLRQKLKLAGAPPNLIETVYGLGYRLNPTLQSAV